MVKTITIADDAYVSLASLRKEDESFSDLICRITRNISLFQLAGILSKKEGQDLERTIKKLRKRY